MERKECPYWKAGPFKIRLPFVHYRFEVPEYLQGLLMCAVCLSAISILQQDLGMPYHIALAIVVLNGILYCTHVLLGDPVVPGWITPAIPLLEAFVLSHAAGPERVQALIAFEMELGIFVIILGITGAAGKLISLIPAPVKSGIILGAGIAAITSVFSKGGRFESAPLTTTVCLVIACFLLFSIVFERMAENNKFWGYIAKVGILPAVLIACIIGPLSGETAVPVFNSIFSQPDFHGLWTNWVAWGAIGWPSAAMYIKTIPTVISIYVVLFGDVVQSKALINDAVRVRGGDEIIDYNPNRAHMIFGARNLLMSIIGPDICMCGPLWAAIQVTVCERYKKGPKAMKSMFGGAGSFRFGTLTGYFIGPIVALVTPIMAVAMSLTLVVQGFVSVRVGVTQAKSFKDLGISGVIAGVIVCRSAAWGLIIGLILTFICYGKNFWKGDVKAGHMWSPEVEAITSDDLKAADGESVQAAEKLNADQSSCG